MLQVIKKICKEKHISISEVERRCNLTSRSIYEWDRHSPSVDKALAVAKELGVTVEELCNDE